MLPIIFQPAAGFAPVVEQYRKAWSEAGHDAPCRVGAVFHSFVGSTSQQVTQRFAPRYAAYYEYTVKAMTGAGAPVLPFMHGFDYDGFVEGSALVGSVQQVVDRIGQYRELLGIDSVLLCGDVGGIPLAEMLSMIDLVGSEVIPAL